MHESVHLAHFLCASSILARHISVQICAYELCKYTIKTFLYAYENLYTKCRDVCGCHINSFLLDNLSHMALE